MGGKSSYIKQVSVDADFYGNYCIIALMLKRYGLAVQIGLTLAEADPWRGSAMG